MLSIALSAAFAQTKIVEDDIYFKPEDAVKQLQRPVNAKKPDYKNGAKEIVFIERGQKVEIVTPDTTILLGEANDSTEQQTEEGYYLNGFNGSQSDLEYAQRIRKFHNPKYRVFIGDPAYNDIYFLNNFDWNVYVEDNYAYVTPTWTNPYWFDYSFRPNSWWGWNSWGYGYPHYSGYYGWGNYPWSYNNYWGGYGGYYGGWYGGMYGSYYGGMYGYGMGYPYYGYGYSPYHQGFYNGYWYGSNYGNSDYLKSRSTGQGTRQANNLRSTTIGGSSTYRDASAVRSNSNYTSVGTSSRTVVNANGARSIRSASDFQNRSTAGVSTNRSVTERNTSGFGGINDRQTGTRTNDGTYRSTSGAFNSGSTRESVVRSGYTAPRISTTPRTSNADQPNQGARGTYSSGSNTRSGYSTGTPAVTRESRSSSSTYSGSSTRSSYNSSTSSGSTYRSTPSYNSGSSSSSYSSGSSSSYSSGSSSGGATRSSSSGSSGGGRR